MFNIEFQYSIDVIFITRLLRLIIVPQFQDNKEYLMKSKLLNEVISDAKAVKETAMQTAINQLKEEFSPNLARLVSSKMVESGELEDEDLDPEDGGEFALDEPVAEMDNCDDEDADLEEILRELEGDDDEEEVAAPAPEAPAAPPAPAPAVPEMSDDESAEDFVDLPAEEEDEEDITTESIDKLIREMEDEMSDTEEPVKESVKRGPAVVNNLRKENKQLKSDLKEAYQAVNQLKNTINDVNLLNGKLMYLQRITNKYKLSESSKMQVLEAIDRAVNIREVKLVYSTIEKQLSSNKVPTKAKLHEGASKPTRSITATPSSDFGFVNRWQELANIKK